MAVSAGDEVGRRERFAFGANRPPFLRISRLPLWTADNDRRPHPWRAMVESVGGLGCNEVCSGCRP